MDANAREYWLSPHSRFLSNTIRSHSSFAAGLLFIQEFGRKTFAFIGGYYPTNLFLLTARIRSLRTIISSPPCATPFPYTTLFRSLAEFPFACISVHSRLLFNTIRSHWMEAHERGPGANREWTRMHANIG